ncbi:unknown [Prevotella sp. CAG:5226]|nr:unknown [Prevotella sp. CAG:5226]
MRKSCIQRLFRISSFSFTFSHDMHLNPHFVAPSINGIWRICFSISFCRLRI